MPEPENGGPLTGRDADPSVAVSLPHLYGRTLFGDDLDEPADLLHCVPGLAPVAVGRISALELDALRAGSGVQAVLTAADIPGTNDCSPRGSGEPILADDNIAFRDQPVFLVVAETLSQATEAARAGHIAAVPGMPVIDIDDALIGGHLVSKDVILQRHEEEVEPHDALRQFSGELRIGGQDHACLETQVAIAEIGADQTLHIRCPTQHPADVRRVVARTLHRPESTVIVYPLPTGGAFGARLTAAARWSALAALAAVTTGRPCKLRLSREQELATTGKRHDFRVDYSAVVTTSGLLRSVDAVLAARSGHSADLSADIVNRAALHADNAYFYPAARIAARPMRTNTVSNTVIRATGAAEAILFAERLMDQSAHSLGLDPLDVRLANLYRAGGTDRSPSGEIVDGMPIRQVVDQLAASADYRTRRSAVLRFNAGSPVLRKGIALTPVRFGVSPTAGAGGGALALVHLLGDGSVTVAHSGVELGQDLGSRIRAAVGAELGVSPGRVTVRTATTAELPGAATMGLAGAGPSVAAAHAAAATLRGRIVDFIEGRWQIAREKMALRDNRLMVAEHPIELSVVARAAAEVGLLLSALGSHRTPGPEWDADTGRGTSFDYWVHGAACSEVTIDTMTGELRLDRVDILQEVGRTLDASADRGQIVGGFVQGLGWLTTEELVWDAGGALATRDFSTYRIPTASALPADFRLQLFDAGALPDRPAMAKNVNEAALPLAASVFSAIVDAIAGLRRGTAPRLDAPATPDSILRAIRGVVGAS
ncbi:MAG: molybdopterin cofactor-binding domain-containing protein [Bauldia sp.]